MDSETAPPPAGIDTPLRHRLLFFGKVLPGFDEEGVREALARHLRRAPAELFSGKRVVVSDELDFIEAETAREALEALGARVQIEAVEAPPPMAPLSFLDLAVPPPPKDSPPPPQDGLAVTDSGWQALSQALEPLPEAVSEGLPELPPLKLDTAQLPTQALSQPKLAGGEGGGQLYPPGSFPQDSPLSSLPTLPSGAGSWTGDAAPSRPPTDLSAVYGSAVPPQPSIDEGSPVFASTARPIAPPPASPPAPMVPVRPTVLDIPPIDGMSMADALPAPASGIPESALLVTCPNCRERQPMRVLCRACSCDLQRALAAQQEERDAVRAAKGRGAASTPRGTGGKTAAVSDDGPRVLGVRIPDHLADRFTLANGLMVLFGLLLLLAAAGFVWNSFFRSEPVVGRSRVAAAAPAAASEASGAQAGEPAASAPRMGPPPSEAEVSPRLADAAAVAEFRQGYWPKATHKVFVANGGSAWAWRAGEPSVTRALSEALGECDGRRLPEAAECKVVNVDNFWQE